MTIILNPNHSTCTQFHILVLGLGNVIWCYLTTLTMTTISNPNHSTHTQVHMLVLGLGIGHMLLKDDDNHHHPYYKFVMLVLGLVAWAMRYSIMTTITIHPYWNQHIGIGSWHGPSYDIWYMFRSPWRYFQNLFMGLGTGMDMQVIWRPNIEMQGKKIFLRKFLDQKHNF